eukprot:TRINITY_DN11647_c0_g1_i1.p1 TRINITY_DN11647_c0_g1~~TRINITY_DN11647_c0_g1_i1.p1  ORF type:complete len:283 (-),score=84.35 TRINITY_DN11647_c0_g1_i1:262-1011(-)
MATDSSDEVFDAKELGEDSELSDSEAEEQGGKVKMHAESKDDGQRISPIASDSAAGRGRSEAVEPGHLRSTSGESDLAPQNIDVPLPLPKGKQVQASPRLPVHIESPDSPSCWNCARCSFKNNALMSHCEMCEGPRAVHEVVDSSDTAQPLTFTPKKATEPIVLLADGQGEQLRELKEEVKEEPQQQEQKTQQKEQQPQQPEQEEKEQRSQQQQEQDEQQEQHKQQLPQQEQQSQQQEQQKQQQQQQQQ